MKTKKRILIVEDDEMAIKLLQLLLEKEGFELVIARDGNQGTEALKTANPDLILMDIMLPYKSGMEVISIAKKNLKDVPIIVLSYLGKVNQTNEEALRLGVSDVIAKPFVVPKLIAKIKLWLA
jgi:two-component system response regulator VicR|tara:strand:- start:8937 stop:9305 length:369 start_codon:yes stop_codon:yes gene_type:complete